MKKVLLGISIALLAVSCKKVADGSNKGRLKLETGVERYDDDAQGGSHASGTIADAHAPLVEIDLNGVMLKGKKSGMEEQLIGFLKSGAYNHAADDSALKAKWFDFDNITFKTGSSDQLEAGSDVQLKNLAEILKAYPEAKIKIGGYTDKTGNEEVNRKISQARALFIKSQLEKLGTGAQVVSAEGYGSEFAAVPATASDTERAKDRRMAVRFTK
ncbi:OmpA family protein [Weeksellaceae bacterium A-14]|uniref:OmpA family protein n=1 Tax=Daejeonia sp. YH14 TaxID=3439042 RepID=UPI0031E4B3D0